MCPKDQGFRAMHWQLRRLNEKKVMNALLMNSVSDLHLLDKITFETELKISKTCHLFLKYDPLLGTNSQLHEGFKLWSALMPLF